jgi:hypothetical protein
LKKTYCFSVPHATPRIRKSTNWDVSSKDIEKQKQKEHFMLRIKTGVSYTVGLADSESGSGSRQINY